jgi:NADP-dependent 3-hydroxy acid dehydrogenase YdfG
VSGPNEPQRDHYIGDKVIIVSGAGNGFGRTLTTMTAAMGARVVATDIDRASVEETAKLSGAHDGHVVALQADVVSRGDWDRVVSEAVSRFGAVDVLINNAGVMPLAFFADHERAAEAWDRAIDINFKGVVNGICAVYDQMIQQGRGHIVNISSIYGNQGTEGSGVYSATKAAVRVLSDALRVEAQGKIKVTVVRPTGVLGTGLGGTVVNLDAIVGLTGQNSARFSDRLGKFIGGDAPAHELDVNDVRYWAITPEDLVRQVVYAIDQPWGVTIGDITVRATGEDYIL